MFQFASRLVYNPQTATYLQAKGIEQYTGHPSFGIYLS
jgi:hypothetical protein